MSLVMYIVRSLFHLQNFRMNVCILLLVCMEMVYFFDMKGVCEEFFEKVGMRDKIDYDPNSGKTYLHPGRQANMIYDGKVVGYLGEVHPLVADTYGIGEKAYVAVIDILTVLEFASFNHKYTGIAKYPAVTRDLKYGCSENCACRTD